MAVEVCYVSTLQSSDCEFRVEDITKEESGVEKLGINFKP